MSSVKIHNQGLTHQDWKEVKLVNNNNNVNNSVNIRGKASSKTQQLAQGLLQGTVETKERPKEAKLSSSQVHKLEDETETFRHPTVSHQFSQALKQHRNSAKLTQDALAQKLSKPVSVIKNYENGTAIPDPGTVAALNRFFAGLGLPALPRAKKAPAKK